jgi:hypothetical protein
VLPLILDANLVMQSQAGRLLNPTVNHHYRYTLLPPVSRLPASPLSLGASWFPPCCRAGAPRNGECLSEHLAVSWAASTHCRSRHGGHRVHALHALTSLWPRRGTASVWAGPTLLGRTRPGQLGSVIGPGQAERASMSWAASVNSARWPERK